MKDSSQGLIACPNGGRCGSSAHRTNSLAYQACLVAASRKAKSSPASNRLSLLHPSLRKSSDDSFNTVVRDVASDLTRVLGEKSAHLDDYDKPRSIGIQQALRMSINEAERFQTKYRYKGLDGEAAITSMIHHMDDYWQHELVKDRGADVSIDQLRGFEEGAEASMEILRTYLETEYTDKGI